MHTHKCSGGVQYSLIGIHVHSQVLRGCSTLTQRCSSALTSVHGVFSSDTNENFLMVTPWWSHSIKTQRLSCALNGCAHSLNGNICTQCVFRGCSHSLIGVHAHSQVPRACLILTQRCSRALTGIQRVFNTDSKAFTHTHKCSGAIQFWHKWDLSHGHTMLSCVQ